jgi:hypothetical protein
MADTPAPKIPAEIPAKTTARTARELTKLSARFNRTVRYAQSALLWERLWPRLVPPLAVGGLFLSASWVGLWGAVPPQARMAGVLTFAVALLASPFLLKTKTLAVSRADAIRRIDANTGTRERPAQMLADRLTASEAERSEHLWNMHINGLWDRWAGNLRAGAPHPGMKQRDPYYIRFAVAAAMIVTGALAGNAAMDRTMQAFDWKVPPAPAPVVAPLEVKAWVVPPDNIDEQPVFLSGDTAKNRDAAIPVHQASRLTVLVVDRKTRVTANGVELPLKRTLAGKHNGKQILTYEYQATLPRGEMTVAIEGGPQWRFNVAPDNPPTVSLDDIAANSKNKRTLDVTCSADDDYGVREGDVIISLPGGGPDLADTPLENARLPRVPLPPNNLCRK